MNDGSELYNPGLRGQAHWGVPQGEAGWNATAGCPAACPGRCGKGSVCPLWPALLGLQVLKEHRPELLERVETEEAAKKKKAEARFLPAFFALVLQGGGG